MPEDADATLQSEVPYALLHSPVPRDRIRAVATLAEVGTAECVELLADGLFDPDPDVVHEVAKGLAHSGSPGAVEHLARVAGNERVAVARRVIAAFALGGLPDLPACASAFLGELAYHPDPWLARTAREVLLQRMAGGYRGAPPRP